MACIICGEMGVKYTFPYGRLELCRTCEPALKHSFKEIPKPVLYRLDNNWGSAIVRVLNRSTTHTRYGYGERIFLEILAISDLEWLTYRFSTNKYDAKTFSGPMPMHRFNQLHPKEISIEELPMYMTTPTVTPNFDRVLKEGINANSAAGQSGQQE